MATTERLNFVVEFKYKKPLFQMAEAKGISFSAYCRKAVLARLKADLIDRKAQQSATLPTTDPQDPSE
jgi:hypothetical protein